MAKKKTSKKPTTRKKSAKKAAKKKPLYCEWDDELLSTLVQLAVVDGATDQQLKLLVPKTYSAAKKIKVVEEVRFRIRAAANWDRSIEIGEAITRCKRIQQLAISRNKLAEAISAQREMSKLMDLYTQPVTGRGDEAPVDEDRVDELDKVEQHLRPLDLAPDDYPVSELARIVASMITQDGATT